MRALLTASLICCLTGLLAFSDETRQKQAQPKRFDLTVREDIFAGFNGDDKRLAAGLKACDEALAKDPKNAEAMVWRGSVLVFQAGQAFQNKDTTQGIKLWTDGLKAMDEAVKLEPQNEAVRIPRAAVLSQTVHFVPATQQKPLLKNIIEDYETVYELQKKCFDQLGTHPRGELRMGLADAYRLNGDLEKSKAQLNQVIRELPGSKYAERANEWLATKDDQKLSHKCIGCHTAK